MMKQLFQHRSLLGRLLWFSLLMLALVAVLIGALVNFVVSQDSLEKAIQQQATWNEIAVRQIDDALNERVTRLEQLAELLVDEDGLKTGPEIQSILDSRLWLHGAFNSGLMVVDRNGRAIFDSPTLKGRVGLQLDDRAYFQITRDTGKSYISEPLFGRVTGAPFFLISAPMYDRKGTFLGIVTGNTLLLEDTVLTAVSKLDVSEYDNIHILDAEHGLIVASSNPALVMKPLSNVAEIDVVQQVVTGTKEGRAIAFGGEDVFFSASRLQTTGWIALNTTPVDSWLNTSESLVWQITIVSFLSLGAVGLIAFVFIRKQLKPLSDAVGELKGIDTAALDGAKALTVQSNDEVGQLVRAFNQVLGQLDSQKGLLVSAREQAEYANEAKTRFLANMSHEIRTPLNAIITLAGIELEKTEDAEGRVRLRKIQRSGEELLTIIEQIISYIELEKGDIESVQNAFEIEALCADLGRQFGAAASEKGLELLISLDADVPTWVVGDKRHLGQVLSHILNNAIKFTREGSVLLRVSKEEADDDQVQLLFGVKDTGVGMSHEDSEQLFEVFGQIDDSHTRAVGGAGMGLALSQRLVYLMGGDRIQLSSEPGQGSLFEFSLSMKPVHKAQSKVETSKPFDDKCTVLIVDDQDLSRQLLEGILSEWKIDTDQADSGEKAVAHVKNALRQGKVYDAILMDWDMPGMDGLSALRIIDSLYTEHSNPEVAPAMLMVSAHDLSCLGYKPDDQYAFLHKPVTRSNLFDALNELPYFRAIGAAPKNNVSKSDSLVLVVDDNKTNREVVEALLNSFGVPHRLAESGREALKLVREEAFDLVFMDIQMPEMDGYETTEQLLKIRPNTPVVALTAASLEKDRKEAEDAGMVGFLTKPLNREAFQAVLENYVTLTPLTESTSLHSVQTGGDSALISDETRILLVDDEPINLKTLAGGLSAEYRLQLANNGEKAIQLAKSDPQPDLILLDIMMPGMDGYDVCRFLKGDPETRDIPIIFVSGLNQSDEETKGLNLGAVDYITKPYEMSVVKARIKKQLEAHQKNELLEQMSYLDALTHVANRRQLDTTLQKEVGRAQRTQGRLGLIILDIDFFKPYNDNYGHGQGDECLKLVAQKLQQLVNRPGDLFARYGGEEFVVLLPETDKEGVTKLAEDMRSAIEDLAIQHEYSAISDHITISLGGVSKRPVSSDSASTLLKEADEALYNAKHEGRNRSVISGD